MNKRLELISSLIPNGIGFADVGTDHGYLPLYMLENGYKGKVFASDINRKPLENAISSARAAGYEDEISFSIFDGLDESIRDEIDTVVIAGMGGDTICGILDRAELYMDKKYLLILQPMTKAEVLRYWLGYNEYVFLEEKLVEDAGEIYQIFTARFGGNGNTRLKDAELFTGQYSLAVKNELFPARLSMLIKRFEKAITGMDGAKRAIGRRAINYEILQQLYKMRDGEFI